MSDPIQPPSAPQVPPAYQAPPPAPGYPAPHGAPTYQPGYQAPSGYQAPPGAYPVPVGGYQAQTGSGYEVPSAQAPASSSLGLLALIAGLIAAVITPIVAGIMAYQIGFAVPDAVTDGTIDAGSLAILAPVRDQVLWAEISFWVGTVLGIFALVAGIIAIVKRRGRGLGIAAVVVAALGPVIYWIVLIFLLTIGASAGAMSTFGGI